MVVRELSRLPLLAPSPWFAARVMARVQLPQPWALLVLGRARAWVREPRRALTLAGTYAVLAVLALGVAVPWLAANGLAVRLGSAWIYARAASAAREVALAIAGWMMTSGTAEALRSLAPSGERVWSLLGALTLGYAGCVLGLHYLLRTPRGKDVRLQPPR